VIDVYIYWYIGKNFLIFTGTMYIGKIYKNFDNYWTRRAKFTRKLPLYIMQIQICSLSWLLGVGLGLNLEILFYFFTYISDSGERCNNNILYFDRIAQLVKKLVYIVVLYEHIYSTYKKYITILDVWKFKTKTKRHNYSVGTNFPWKKILFFETHGPLVRVV
jgi:hypothetical protein